jgi:hypothetical protein
MGALVLRAVVAVAAGTVIFLAFTLWPGDGADVDALLALPQYRLWRLLVAGSVVVGVAATPNLWALRRTMSKLLEDVSAASGRAPATERRMWIGYALLAGALIAGQIASSDLHPLAGWRWRSGALFAVGFVIAMPAAVSMWLATPILTQIRSSIAAMKPPPDGQMAWGKVQEETIRRLADLRTLLHRLLAILATTVSTVTLATGALRVALLATPHPPSYPISAPLLLGLALSVVVAASYLPAAVQLQDTCSEFADKVVPVPSNELSETWAEDRQRVEKLLPTGDGAKDAVSTSLAIVAPVVTSLSGVLFK